MRAAGLAASKAFASNSAPAPASCARWRMSASPSARARRSRLSANSGSGKSVTAYAVMGILDPAGRVTAGRAMFGGLDLLAAKPRRACRGARPRDRDDLSEPAHRAQSDPPGRPPDRRRADSPRQAVAPRRRRAAAVEMLRAVGITDPERRAKAYPFEMSGGMCQRVMIAIALAAKPSLLIADEPTTGLDVTTQAVIMDLIGDLARKLGMATIFITHDLALAGQRCGAHRRHACRPRGRERADRGIVRAPAPSLHGRTDRGDAGFGGEPRRAGLDSRLAARSAPRRPAAVPLFRALPAQDRAPARSRCRMSTRVPAHVVACWNPLPAQSVSAPIESAA